MRLSHDRGPDDRRPADSRSIMARAFGVDPARAERRQLSVALDRVADDERRRLLPRSRQVLAEVSAGAADLVGGRVDELRGGAWLRFGRATVAVASPDTAELRAVISAAARLPVRLAEVREGPGARLLGVFAVGEWTVVARLSSAHRV